MFVDEPKAEGQQLSLSLWNEAPFFETMNNTTKGDQIYGATKIGIPSTGADVGDKAGLVAS